jgi:single-strand DNA-binding protein
MAGSVNKVILVGNLGRDPEVRYSKDGNKIVNMSLATSESWTDRSSGERQEKTEWHRVVIFNDRLCEIAEKYLNKGSKIYVEGQLQTGKWTGNDGQERNTTEVVLNRFRGELTMLDSRSSGALKDGSSAQGSEFGGSEESVKANSDKIGTVSDQLDDEIPF